MAGSTDDMQEWGLELQLHQQQQQQQQQQQHQQAQMQVQHYDEHHHQPDNALHRQQDAYEPHLDFFSLPLIRSDSISLRGNLMAASSGGKSMHNLVEHTHAPPSSVALLPLFDSPMTPMHTQCQSLSSSSSGSSPTESSSTPNSPTLNVQTQALSMSASSCEPPLNIILQSLSAQPKSDASSLPVGLRSVQMKKRRNGGNCSENVASVIPLNSVCDSSTINSSQPVKHSRARLDSQKVYDHRRRNLQRSLFETIRSTLKSADHIRKKARKLIDNENETALHMTVKAEGSQISDDESSDEENDGKPKKNDCVDDELDDVSDDDAHLYERMKKKEIDDYSTRELMLAASTAIRSLNDMKDQLEMKLSEIPSPSPMQRQLCLSAAHQAKNARSSFPPSGGAASASASLEVSQLLEAIQLVNRKYMAELSAVRSFEEHFLPRYISDLSCYFKEFAVLGADGRFLTSLNIRWEDHALSTESIIAAKTFYHLNGGEEGLKEAHTNQLHAIAALCASRRFAYRNSHTQRHLPPLIPSGIPPPLVPPAVSLPPSASASSSSCTSSFSSHSAAGNPNMNSASSCARSDFGADSLRNSGRMPSHTVTSLPPPHQLPFPLPSAASVSASFSPFSTVSPSDLNSFSAADIVQMIRDSTFAPTFFSSSCAPNTPMHFDEFLSLSSPPSSVDCAGDDDALVMMHPLGAYSLPNQSYKAFVEVLASWVAMGKESYEEQMDLLRPIAEKLSPEYFVDNLRLMIAGFNDKGYARRKIAFHPMYFTEYQQMKDLYDLWCGNKNMITITGKSMLPGMQRLSHMVMDLIVIRHPTTGLPLGVVSIPRKFFLGESFEVVEKKACERQAAVQKKYAQQLEDLQHRETQ